MRQYGLYLSTALILCITAFAGRVFAQAAEDSVKTDTVRNKYFPTGVRIGVDVINAGKSLFQDNYEGWEMQGDIDLNRYQLALEFGNSARDLASDSATYGNSGSFWRAGVDVNFLMKDPERNAFFLGARYAKSRFTESMTIQRYDPIWGSRSENFHHDGVKASWIELTAGLKVKIWGVFWLGYTARFKFALSDTGSPDMLPYDVPGFGNTNKGTTWGFNYYLMVRLPIRKAPPPPTE